MLPGILQAQQLQNFNWDMFGCATTAPSSPTLIVLLIRALPAHEGIADGASIRSLTVAFTRGCGR